MTIIDAMVSIASCFSNTKLTPQFRGVLCCTPPFSCMARGISLCQPIFDFRATTGNRTRNLTLTKRLALPIAPQKETPKQQQFSKKHLVISPTRILLMNSVKLLVVIGNVHRHSSRDILMTHQIGYCLHGCAASHKPLRQRMAKAVSCER